MRPHVFSASLLACVLLSACKPADPPAPAVASNARPVQETSAEDRLQQQLTAHDNLNAVAWIQTSVEYTALSTQTYRAAADHLDAALKHKHWDALAPDERGNELKGLKPAVIMDVDETVLDNSPYQARLIADGKEYNDLSWDQWVAEKKAKAVPGVLDFARAATAKGVTILYISNRAVHLKEATLANLREQGLPVADDSVFLGLGTVLPGCEQQGSEKGCRRKLAGQKYRVLMQFGDQIGDFVEVPANTREGRKALYDNYRDWFGERWWMLPNPSYGSWEPALFNNDWQQSPQARSQAKRAALELAR
ncbi:5'-nucleotidase, lipoprotein e(P4) family [Pseudoxanthomonas dokdonensis]|nr:5'-nucleotidase, lipoprotein e(P4) family [Pseudoxanthomonas dokdonensis]